MLLPWSWSEANWEQRFLYIAEIFQASPFASEPTDITNLIKEGFLINALRGENRFVLPVISGTQGLCSQNLFALPHLKRHFQRHIYGLVWYSQEGKFAKSTLSQSEWNITLQKLPLQTVQIMCLVIQKVMSVLITTNML